MDPVGFFSGITTGLDWRSLVDQIMELERQPVARFETQVSRTESKISAFQDFRTRLDALRTAAAKFSSGQAFGEVGTTVAGATSAGVPLLSASAASGTAPGQYSVEVLSRASAEKLGGTGFDNASSVLGLTGEFFVNGRRIHVVAADTLTNIRDKINTANVGADATRVTASLLTVGGVHRLMLTSDQTGAAGIDLKDGPGGVLSTLGFIDDTTSIKNGTSSGGTTDRFTDATSTVASLLGLTTASGPQTVTIGGQTVDIDLDTQSLTDIAANIDALTGVTATVVNGGDAENPSYYIDIRNTTGFVDAGNALELLGVVERGRDAVAQTVHSAALTDSDGTTPATGSTLLSSLYSGGAAAGVQVGDTFTIAGTRGDGSAVNITYTVGGGDTMQDLVDALNDATTGFGAGSRTATASIDASGRIVLTDDTSGDSQLSLSMVTNNEGGGTLDFGDIEVAELGRTRRIVSAADAQVRIDGITVSHASNTLSGVIPGVTLTLHSAEPGTLASVTVARSVEGAAANAQAFVESYNAVVQFIQHHIIVEPDATTFPALFGDATLRLTRSSISNVLLETVTGVTTDMATASAAGIQFNGDGTLVFNRATFEDAFHNRYSDLRRLFVEEGTPTDSEVLFLSSGGTAVPGTYDVDITAAATQATLLGAGFSGTYTDDGTADALTVTQLGSGYVASIALTNGMTTSDIVDALNQNFQSTAQHELTGSEAFYTDAGGTTAATDETTFDSLFSAGGTAANVISGDTITYGGSSASGQAFSGTFTVNDAATTTLGDLAQVIQTRMGDGATVSIVDGRIVIQDDDEGKSPIALTITANNEGAGSLDFGTFDVTTQGKLVMALEATAVGSEIQLQHTGYGSEEGFTVAVTAGGADGTAQLGLGAATYNGTDVQGTIGAFAATGAGQTLVADEGSAVSGMRLQYMGSTARTAGNVALTVGTGAAMERFLDRLFELSTGPLDAKEQIFNDRIGRLNDRIDAMEARLELRRASLIRQFTTMEILVGQFQAQSQALSSQITGLLGQGGSGQ